MAQRDEKGRWVKGCSGNEGGMKPRFSHVREAARAHSDEAITVLVGIMLNAAEPARARVTAAIALLDRAWGKPTQPLDHRGEGFNLVLHLGGATSHSLQGKTDGR